jgi:Tfp pilus assembly protein PilN
MRPVNLIPVEERRGENAPLRSGLLVYVVVGALVALLAGVTAMVLTGNQIADSKSEVTQLKREDTVARDRAERLASYSQYRALREARLVTVASLADSRFDWERVMRELALIQPKDAWLVSLAATVSPEASAGLGGGSGGGSTMRSAIAGPALEISGCASGHEAVAGFVTALKEIDGVTRVGVQSSELADSESGAGTPTEGSASSGEDCRTRHFITQFEIVVAFDAAPVALGAEGGEAPAAAPEIAETTSTETSEGG